MAAPDRFCSGCGRPAVECPGCARPLDPPRFCAACGHRLRVQVTPGGYTSACRGCGATGGDVAEPRPTP